MDTQNPDSVINWLKDLHKGDADAAHQLWNRFFEKLVQRAEVLILKCPEGVLDAEDIAASVFESLWRGAQEGRFQDVQDQDELWWLLLSLTRQKSAKHIRRESAQKRGGNISKISLNDEKHLILMEQLAANIPPPDYMSILEEEYARCLNLLSDDALRHIAVHRLEGFTNQEISEQLGISISTVKRKFRLIMNTWVDQLKKET